MRCGWHVDWVFNMKMEGEMRGYGEKRGRGVSESYSWIFPSSAISFIDLLPYTTAH